MPYILSQPLQGKKKLETGRERGSTRGKEREGKRSGRNGQKPSKCRYLDENLNFGGPCISPPLPIRAESLPIICAYSPSFVWIGLFYCPRGAKIRHKYRNFDILKFEGFPGFYAHTPSPIGGQIWGVRRARRGQ